MAGPPSALGFKESPQGSDVFEDPRHQTLCANSLHEGEFEVARKAKRAELQSYVCLELLCIEIHPPSLGDPVGSPSGWGQIATGGLIPVRLAEMH